MAPTTAGTNIFTALEDRVVDSLSNLPSFQTWTSSANATEARDHCYVGIFNKFASTEDALDRSPFVLIDAPDDAAQFRNFAYARGAPSVPSPPGVNAFNFQCDSAFVLEFRQKRPAQFFDDAEETERLFKNIVGTIMIEMKDRAAVDGFYGLTEGSPDGPVIPEEANKQWAWMIWPWTIMREQEAAR